MLNKSLIALTVVVVTGASGAQVANPGQVRVEPVTNAASDRQPAPAEPHQQYLLGPSDQLTIWAVNVEEISAKPFRIDSAGYLNLPMAGRIKAAGLTVHELEEAIEKGLRAQVREPEVSVSVTEFRSQPISVMGAVNTPGVYYLNGPTTLVQALSLAGGVRENAGYSIRITRRSDSGAIPLPTAQKDHVTGFSVAEVSVKSVLAASNPTENILVRPHDVITVPRADMVYVMGEVQKAGGFLLTEQESISVLQAVSLAGGLSRLAAPGNTRLLRAVKGSSRREELIDLKKILSGKAKDIPLNPDDILYIPNSKSRAITARAIEAAVSIGTGVLIWRF